MHRVVLEHIKDSQYNAHSAQVVQINRNIMSGESYAGSRGPRCRLLHTMQ
jgi:hypothetical protein